MQPSVSSPNSGKRLKSAAAGRSAKPAPKQRSPRKAQAPPLVLVLQQERVKVPGRPGKVSKADKYRYPKGHPKAGQYAPKSSAEKGAKVTRFVRKRGGRRVALVPTGEAKVRKLRRRTVDIGRSFTESVPAFTAIDAVLEAAAKGRTLFVKVGGRILEIPEERKLDAAAWLTDLKAAFISSGPKNKQGGGYPFNVELSYGGTGVLINMDRIEYFTKELREELGSLSENQQLAQELASYISRSADTFLDVTLNPDDILEAWDSEGSTSDDED